MPQISKRIVTHQGRVLRAALAGIAITLWAGCGGGDDNHSNGTDAASNETSSSSAMDAATDGDASDTPPAVVCNFLTGVATGVGAGTCIASPAICDGMADDTAAFNAFAGWAKGTWQASHKGRIELFIPPASHCQLTTTDVTFDGITELLVVGYGATLAGNYYHLAEYGMYQDRAHSVRLVSVAEGATAVTINPTSPTQPGDGCQTISACAALFSSGQWAFIAGVDLQNGVGFPINAGVFEYVQVTGVDATTGGVTFSQPLAHAYKSTWPTYIAQPTEPYSPDYGGPATLFALPATWNATVEWRGITFDTSNQLDAPGLSTTFRDVTCTVSGQGCFAPTLSKEPDRNYRSRFPDRTA